MGCKRGAMGMSGAGTANGGAMTSSHLVIDDFLPLAVAQSMRRDIETHFGRPEAHAAITHQIWNYWHVPGQYTYLRTNPERLMARPKVEDFVGALRAWSTERLGFADVSWPYLSLYVAGCRQGLHNDSENGRFAFVYSLTKNDRKTTGGETLVFKEGDLFRDHVGKSNAGPGFYAAIEPKFNRLVIFDDRMPHAVERVDGSMDPMEGRFVFHGHIKENGAIVTGALSPQAASDVVMSALVPFCDEAFARIRLYHGPLVLRLNVSPAGEVASCAVVLDRVAAADRSDAEWPRLKADLVKRFEALKFREADGPTTITQPVMFGASLFRAPA